MTGPIASAGRFLLVAAAAAVVLAVAERTDRVSDWTADRRLTLSVGTRERLASVDRDVEIVAFFRRGGEEEAARANVAGLLESYSRESARVRWRFVDPEAEPREAERAGAGDRMLVVRAGDRTELVRSASESTLTAALGRLLRPRNPVVVFVGGHREKSPQDPGRDGLSGLGAALADQGIRTDVLAPVDAQTPPEAPDLVVLAGPRIDPSPAELEWLAGRLDAGGAVLVWLDPAPLPRLESWLAERGIAPGHRAVLDPRTRLFGADASVPVVTDYAPHAITDALRPAGGVVPTFFPVARALDATAARATVLLETSAEAREEGEDVPASRALGVCVEQESGADLVVVGDSDFAANGNFALSGNGTLAVSMIEWLLRDDADVAVPIVPVVRPRLLSESEFRARVTTPALALPVVCATIGIAVVARRRRGAPRRPADSS
ncbi:MAG: Gldg family protein [Gemmatimonadetes bacterium]|nr:Gldg family protein [Gemmatimonadota bacterium]